MRDNWLPNKTNDGAHGIVIRFFLFSFCMKTLLKKVTNYILTYNSCISLFSQSHVTLPHVTLGNKNCDLIYAIIEERHWTKNLDKTSTSKIIVTDTSELLCRWHILEYQIFIQFPKQKLFFHFVCLLFKKPSYRLSIFSILFNYYFFILTLIFFGCFL